MAEKPPTSEQFAKFTALVDQVMSVPKAEIDRREAEYQRQAQTSPSRRGPKPKKAKRPS